MSLPSHETIFIKYKSIFSLFLDESSAASNSKQRNKSGRSKQVPKQPQRASQRTSVAMSRKSSGRKRLNHSLQEQSDSVTSTSSSSMQTEDDSDEDGTKCHGDYDDNSPSLPKIRKKNNASDAHPSAYAVAPALLSDNFIKEFQGAWLRADNEESPPPISRSTRNTRKEQLRKNAQLSKSLAASSDDAIRVSESMTLYSTPFKICIAQNFLDDPAHVRKLIKEMCSMDWQRKQMDLYEFHQTIDLANLSFSTNPALRTFHQTLTDVMLPWMRQISGLNLTHVSASCSMYNYGDFLLVHDDLLTDRQIAFVYYLTPWPGAKNWSEEMGGALELFTCENGQPKYPIARKLPPRNNQFVFFKVCSKSFHQVGEVTNVVYPRLTINGWFHGPLLPNESDSSHSDALVPINGLTDLRSSYNIPVMDELDLSEWINTIYLQQQAIVNIQQHIEDNSEASLEKFLIKDFYDLLVSEFRDNKDLEWVLEGPANQRKYETLRFSAQSTGPPKDLHTLFTSKSMFTLLHQYTELDFDGPKIKTPTCSVQICRFTQGCYTLLGDSSTFSESALDVVLFFNVKNQVGTVTYLCPNILARACASNECSTEGDGNTNTSSEWNSTSVSAEASSSTTHNNRCAAKKTSKNGSESETNVPSRKGGARRNAPVTGPSTRSPDTFDDSYEDAEVVAIMNRDLSSSSAKASSSDSAPDNDDDDDPERVSSNPRRNQRNSSGMPELLLAPEEEDDEEAEDEENDDDEEVDNGDGEETGEYGDQGPEGVLLTVHPKNNALNLVYRLDGQAKFVKYASKSCIKDDEYVYILFATFKE